MTKIMEVAPGALSPAKQLEICNAINAAVVADKTVTMDSVSKGDSILITGAFPGWYGVRVITARGWEIDGITRHDKAPTQELGKDDYVIRTYYPLDTKVDIIYKPDALQETIA